MNKIGEDVKEGMNKITSETKNIFNEMKVQYDDKKEDIQDFISEKKFVHDLKTQMKNEDREEGRLVKNLYNKTMAGGKEIAKELKNDIQNEMKD